MPNSPSRPQRDIWPRQTNLPSYSKRRRVLAPRQTITDLSQVIQAETECQLDSGNEVISCFPKAGVVVPQEQWASFVCMSS